MDTSKRLKKVVNWLIYKEVAENERALADLLGYTKSSFSQIVNCKVPLSDKFVKKICSLDENINEVWVATGEGDMFISDNPISVSAPTSVTISADAWSVIRAQAESLSAKDRLIDSLLELLRNEQTIRKNSDAHTEDDAECAAVG